jgi:hypothetical protein
MIARACMALIAMGLTVSLLSSAPAPFPGPRVAEAVLGVPSPSHAASLRSNLSTPNFLRRVVLAPKVRGLDGLRGEKDPVGWLQDRLKIEVRRQGKEVRIRIANCRASEALLLLATLVDVAGTNQPEDPRRRDSERLQAEKVRRVLAIKQMQGRMQGNAQVQVLEELVARLEMDQHPPSVLQKPRLVLPRD